MKLMSYSLDGEESILDEAVKILSEGGLIVYPTDTIYGIGADACRKESVNKVFEVKKRSTSNPLSILVSDFRMMSKYAVLNESQKELVHELLPGKVSVVLNSSGVLAPNLSEDGSIAFRIPLNPLPIKIVERLNRPITSTSANVHGKKVPGTVEGIIEQLGDKIDFYIDYGELFFDPSTLVDLRGKPKILREGMDLKEVKRILHSF